MSEKDIKTLRIALAGQPNVGKSVIFNKLTGMNQVIGNWPGKTVAKAEGYALFKGYKFEIIDLPGIYSLSSYSLEEVVSRDYILQEQPDFIVNVVDANHLERNLFLTLQLLLLKRPLILVLNQYDVLVEQGYEIDVVRLEKLLNVPVIRTIATRGKGVHQILELIIDVHKRQIEYKNGTSTDTPSSESPSSESIKSSPSRLVDVKPMDTGASLKRGRVWEKDFSRVWSDVKADPFITGEPYEIVFGREVEVAVNKVIDLLKDYEVIPHPLLPERYTAQKLIEQDSYIIQSVEKVFRQKKGEDCEKKFTAFMEEITRIKDHLEEFHGHSISEIFNQEYYAITTRITNDVLIRHVKQKRQKLRDFFDKFTVHPVWGLITVIIVLFGSYILVFMFGDFISGLFDDLYSYWTDQVVLKWSLDSLTYKIVWNAIVGGLMAGIGGVLPYVIPFYFIIEILQDTGYLPRAAYVMDRAMHVLGLHGKAIIPVLLGFGCNVPAVTATMIMDSEKEKRRAVVIASMVPCSAVSVIVLGLVGKYMGLQWALLLYIINFIVMAIVGNFMKKIDQGKEDDLIIEFHDFRKPNFSVIFKQTWFRSKEFVYRALPLMVLMGIIVQIFMELNWLEPLNTLFKPITVDYLGLPVGVSVFLIYGILRKELNLILLQTYVLSLGLTMTEYMTPIQMIVFTLMTMLYVPCIATIIVIKHHTSTKFATQVFFILLGIALIVAGAVRWGYELVVYLMHL